MHLTDLIPVAVVSVFPVATLMHYRLVAKAQPLRLQLAEKGERLLAFTDLPPEVRKYANRMLDTAFGFGVSPLIAIIVFPFFIGWVFLFERKMRARFARDLSALSAEQRALLDDATNLHVRIIFVHHPLSQTVLGLEMMVIAIAALLYSALSNRPIPDTEKLTVALDTLELSSSKLALRKALAA